MSRRTRGDLQLILPKEGSSTVYLPKEDPSEITKVIDLQIEDFLKILNEAAQQLQLKGFLTKNFFKSPIFLIGDQELSVGCWLNEDEGNIVMLDLGDSDHLRSILVTGNCGNLAFEKRADDTEHHDEFLAVELGSIEKLREAMTTSGSNKLDLQLTVTVRVAGNSDDDQWIIPT